jgi:hypothetical protein
VEFEAGQAALLSPPHSVENRGFPPESQMDGAFDLEKSAHRKAN